MKNFKSLDLIDENTIVGAFKYRWFDLSALQDFLRDAYNKLGIPESAVPAISISLDKDGLDVTNFDPAIQKNTEERMEDRL